MLTSRWLFGRVRWVAAGSLLACGAAQAQDAGEAESRLRELPVQLDKIEQLKISTGGMVLENTMDEPEGGELRGAGCSDVQTYVDPNLFNGGSFLAQGGFAQGEVAAATYTLDPGDFPIRLDLSEIIFATQNAAVQTITEWSFLVWDGEPNSGVLIAQFSSDDIILPHLRVGPGNQGVNLSVAVDPGDPEQIFITNGSGQNKFTVGFRVDAHNVPGSDPCGFGPPPSTLNAFPTTSTGPVSNPGANWIDGLNCGFGPLVCIPGGGWVNFNTIFFLCQPSGDWVIRASWTKVNCVPGFGACCFTDGTCGEMFSGDCVGMGGTYQGDGTTCLTANCPVPTGACCNPSGGCLGDLTEAQCMSFGGNWAGAGTDCSDVDGNMIADVCETPSAACNPADLNDAAAANPAAPNWGVPDGILTPTDFSAFAFFFSTSDLRADLNDAAAPSPAFPLFGQPDGLLTPTDFSAFAAYFGAGCPCTLPGCP